MSARGRDVRCGASHDLRHARVKQSLTTSDKKPSERLEFWQEIVCKKYVSASAETKVRGDEFAGSLTSSELGPLVVAELDAPLHFWSRKPQHVHNDGQEVFIVSLIQQGAGELTQRGRSAQLGPGDLVIYDSGATFDYALRAKTQLVKIPRRLLESKLDRPHDFLALKIDRKNPLSSILGDLLSCCLEIDLSLDLSPRTAKRLSNAIVDLLVSICDLERDTLPETQISGPLERVVRFARANLDDPELGPDALAGAAAISMRTLSRLFGALGTTPMRWVWSERLEASRTSLLQGEVRSVTEAAFAHGFSDLGHFSRSFKRTFGISPQKLLRT
jgi:AraC-like DNA-binding protein/mannose-6-phosphate isomerase-like protein (cupin superfamily)